MMNNLVRATMTHCGEGLVAQMRRLHQSFCRVPSHSIELRNHG